MGGGPSRAEREAEQRMRDLQAQQQAQQQQFIQVASQPDPLEERLRARDMKWLDWEDQPVRDVSQAPLGPALDLYNRAANRQQGERMGIGALRMGLNASNPMLSQVLDEQSRERRQQEAAGDLEQAVRLKSAEVNRSALPLAEFAQNRRMGLASLASGNAANSTNAYLQFLMRPKKQSFWKQLLLGGLGAAGSMGSAYLGRDRG